MSPLQIVEYICQSRHLHTYYMGSLSVVWKRYVLISNRHELTILILFVEVDTAKK